jgi:putative ABC transport system substrate-binding protein
MIPHMRRREFIALIGGAAAWPGAARAQPPALPVIGFLHGGSAGPMTAFLAAFREGLKEAGYTEGRNVALEIRWAEGRYDRLPGLAAELVNRQVAVIATGGGMVAAMAAKSATSTVPIVFSGGSDPVAADLVASLSRPGGNVTGVVNIAAELTAKRMELLRELVPTARMVAVLRNPANPEAAAQLREIEAAARLIGFKVAIADASRESEFEMALVSAIRQRVDALLVVNDPFYGSVRQQLIALVATHRLPAIWAQRLYTEAGGLISYGTNFEDVYRQVGVYAGRILKGEKPADLPVMRPTRFELVINLKTAKAIGLDVPWFLQQRADEVIE